MILSIHTFGNRVIIADRFGKKVAEIISRDKGRKIVAFVRDVPVGGFSDLQKATIAAELQLGGALPAINCLLSQPGNWFTTGLTACVAGFRTRSEKRIRTIITQPANGGTACGPTFETRNVNEACEDTPQPVNCVLAASWNAWVTTNLTACVGSLRTRTEVRTRDVVTQPANGGTACGPTWETRDVEEACTVEVPSVNCVLAPSWNTWTTTNLTACVGSLRTRTEERTRDVVTPPENGGTACGPTFETRDVEEACLSPVDCVLAPDWNAWITTNLTACAGSLRVRTEERIRIVLTQPENGGTACGPTWETRSLEEVCVMPPVESADGTRGATVTDAQLSIWTFGTNGETLRNEVNFNYGQGTVYLYWNGVVYHKGAGGHWYNWLGSTWIDTGTNDPTFPPDSANNTRITPGSGSITLANVVYTVVNLSLLANGVLAYGDGGWLDVALLHNGVLYAHQPGNSHWYHHDGTTWIDDGLDDPETGATAVVLTLATAGSGSGTTSGGGSYVPGTIVGLGAIPASGSQFDGWAPAPCAASFTMPGSPLTCTATFSVGGGGGGTGPMRSIITTGSVNIASNPRQWTVANSGILPGDWFIAATGKEPGQGLPGTRGVGGHWPATRYATVAAMNAAYAAAPANLMVWVEENGFVYVKTGGAWQRNNNLDSGNIVYWNYAEPFAFMGIVLSVVGNVVTMDRDAQVSVTNADVFVDMAPVVNALPPGTVLPSGWFPQGGATKRTILRGQGQTLTRLFSPDGCPSQMHESSIAGSIIEDITLQGNFKAKGWCNNRTTSTPAQFNQPVTESYATMPQLGRTPHAIGLTGGATDSIVRNTTIIDCATGAVWWQAQRVLITDVKSVHTVGLAQYVQWDFNAVNGCAGSIVLRARVESPTLVRGFEPAFGATNTLWDQCSGINATCSANGAGSWLYRDLNLRFTAGCNVQGKGSLSTLWQPICSINTNAGVQAAGQGGQHLRTVIIQEGPVNANGTNFPGVVVDHENPLIVIDGLRYTCQGQGQAVNATAQATIFKNGLFVGTDGGAGQYAAWYGRGSNNSQCTNNVGGTQSCYGTWP